MTDATGMRAWLLLRAVLIGEGVLTRPWSVSLLGFCATTGAGEIRFLTCFAVGAGTFHDCCVVETAMGTVETVGTLEVL